MTGPAETIEMPRPWRAPCPLPRRFETTRSVLRFWEADDAPGMLEALDVDRGAYLPWLPWVARDNQNLAECTYQIERSRREAKAGRDYIIGIFDRRTGAVIGGTGFHRMDKPSWHAEIGYWVRPERRGQGLCTEAVAGMLSWGFALQDAGGWGFRRLEIYCAGGNLASQRVPEKLGLRREVIRRGARWVDGLGWNDVLGWGVLADEWDSTTAGIKR